MLLKHHQQINHLSYCFPLRKGIPLYATLTLQNLLKFNEQEEKAEGLFLQCISPHYRNLIDAEEVPPGDHLIIRCDYHLTESGIEESTVRLAISSLCTSLLHDSEIRALVQQAPQALLFDEPGEEDNEPLHWRRRHLPTWPFGKTKTTAWMFEFIVKKVRKSQ